MFASGKWKELADNTPTACFLLRISYSLSSELHILSFFLSPFGFINFRYITVLIYLKMMHVVNSSQMNI